MNFSTHKIRTRQVSSSRAQRISAQVALVLLMLLAGCTGLKRFAYEGFGRDGWQKPEQVIEALRIQPGNYVADLGAGSGYFTFRLSAAVGPTGKVYAVDVDPGILEYLKKKIRDEGYANVGVIQAEYHDPKLPEAGVDMIFVCNTYHHIEKRADYFKRAKRYLRKGGRVAIIDFNGVGWLEWLFVPVVPKDMVQREMQAAGYRLEREHDFLPRQYFLVFAGE